MKQSFDDYLRKKAQEEPIRTPEGFDGRVALLLNSLKPERQGVAAPRRLKRRAAVLLVAAATVLLTATALAATYFIGMRETGEQEKSQLQTEQAAVASPGWQPEALRDLSVSVPLGDDCTATLTQLLWNSGETPDAGGELVAHIRINAPEGTGQLPLSGFALSIDGGEPIVATILTEAAEPHSTSFGNADFTSSGYHLAECPLAAGHTMTFTGNVGGRSFTIPFSLDEKTFAAFREAELAGYEKSADLFNDIPSATKETFISAYGYAITEIAVKDGWLFYTKYSVEEYWKNLAGAGRPTTVEATAMHNAGFDVNSPACIDGRIMAWDYVAGGKEDVPGAEYQMRGVYRVYLGRDKSQLPKRSLLLLSDVIFEYDWATGEATAPKDAAEEAAWREKNIELMLQYAPNALFRPAVSGKSFTFSAALYDNEILPGTWGIQLTTPGEAPDARDEIPVVKVNGETLLFRGDSRLRDAAMEGGRSTADGKQHGFMYLGTVYADLPDSFSVSVTWRGETLTATFQKSAATNDYERREFKTVFGY